MYTFWQKLQDVIADESGQGITEYGAILAFVAVLITILVATQGAVGAAVARCYSTIATTMNALNAAVQAAIGGS